VLCVFSHKTYLLKDKTGSLLLSEDDDIIRVISRYKHVITPLYRLYYNRKRCNHLMNVYFVYVVRDE
jgi:hypothetical protein